MRLLLLALMVPYCALAQVRPPSLGRYDIAADAVALFYFGGYSKQDLVRKNFLTNYGTGTISESFKGTQGAWKTETRLSGTFTNANPTQATTASIACRMYITATNEVCGFVTLSDAGAGSTGWGLVKSDYGCGNTTNLVAIFFPGAACVGTGSTVPVSTGAWHSLIVVRQNTFFQLYVDGVLATSGSGSPRNNLSTDVIVANAGSGGRISSVIVWERALTAREAQIYHDSDW